MPEFTEFNARRVEIKVGAVFTEYVRSLYNISLQDVIDARERLRVWANGRTHLTHAYGVTVVSHTFDQDTWDIVIEALYDTDVTEIVSSAVELLDEYFAVEHFFYEDTLLQKSCWYTGFNIGDHDSGAE